MMRVDRSLLVSEHNTGGSTSLRNLGNSISNYRGWNNRRSKYSSKFYSPTDAQENCFNTL